MTTARGTPSEPDRAVAGKIESRRLTLVLVALLALGLGYTAYRAATLGVDYYDAYVYLNNASWLAGAPTTEYDVLRPPLVPLLQVPIVAAARAAGPANPWLTRGPHLASAGLTLLTTLAIFFLLRGAFGTTLALLGAVLFIGTRYVIRYGAHVMVDVPLTGLTAAAFALLWRAHERDRLALHALAGVALGGAVLAKYSAGLSVAAFVPASLLLALRGTRLARPGRWLAGLLLALAAAAVVFGLVQDPIFRALAPDRPWSHLVEALRRSADAVGTLPGESRRDHLVMAVIMLSPPLVLLALLGLGVTLHRPERRDVPFLAWLAVVGGGTVVLVRHSEARYFLPVAPTAIYFALRGTEWLLRGPARGRLGQAATAVLLGLCLVGGARQAWEDADPFFADDLQRRAAVALAGAARGTGRLFVVGTFHTLFPADPGPVAEDEFWNTFHYGAVIPAYFLGREPTTLSSRSAPAWALRDVLGAVAADGDAVLRFEDVFYVTRTRPEGHSRPFEVWSIQRVELVRAGGDRFASADGRAGGTVTDAAAGAAFVPDQTLGERWLFLKSRPTSSNAFAAATRVESGMPIHLPARARDIGTITLMRVEIRLVE